MLEPIKMKPVFKEAIWGGTTLKTKYNKEITSDKTSESWEIAAHKNGQSIAVGGAYDKKTLGEIADMLKEQFLGDYVIKKYPDKFPLLVKFLDCNDKLSVQVHPDDAYAAINENGELGKTEMWYILDAKPDAKLIYGFNRNVTKEEFRSAIENGTLDEILNYVPAKAGDCFFIQSRTLHALLDGLLVAEIQQNSDTTYRVYDHGRVDKNGKSRELHIDKSVDVTDTASSVGNEKVIEKAEKMDGGVKYSLCGCEYFETEKYEVESKMAFETNRQSFEMLIFYAGDAKIAYSGGEMMVREGDSVVIPAYLGGYCVEGKSRFLKSFVPKGGVKNEKIY